MSQPHTYKSLTPSSTPPAPGISQFFESFYRVSDTPTAHEEYVKFFTPEATLIMASKQGNGSSEILEIRKSMWKIVESRLHTARKIFPFGEGSNEVMLFGDVEYVLIEGKKKVKVEWAARAVLVRSEDGYGEEGEGGDKWKMGFYQVYLDTAAMAAAAAAK